MHRSIACLAAVVGTAAGAGPPLLAQEAGAVRGTVTLEENGGFVRGAMILVVGSGAFTLTDERGWFALDADHGVAVDPNVAERIEIVRGPVTLLYGSNAVGGLVNVITPHESTRESLLDGTRAQLSADLGSANAQAGANVGLQHARNGVHYWGGGSRRRTEDYATPLGIVENSATESTNARAGVGWSGDRLYAAAGVTLNDGRYGVPFAGEFHGHHEGESGGHGGDLDGETAIALDWQRRAVRFDVGNPDLDAETTLGLDLSLRHRRDRVRGDLNLFRYDIGNFIFGDRTGEVLDNLPVFDVLQGDSRFVGFDARGSVRLAGRAWATLGLRTRCIGTTPRSSRIACTRWAARSG